MGIDTDAVSPEVDVRNMELREVYEGKVANTVTDLGDDLYVIIPQFDDEDGLTHRHGPVHGWDIRSDGSYPTRDDSALVAVSDLGNYWMLSWSPS